MTRSRGLFGVGGLGRERIGGLPAPTLLAQAAIGMAKYKVKQRRHLFSGNADVILCSNLALCLSSAESLIVSILDLSYDHGDLR